MLFLTFKISIVVRKKQGEVWQEEKQFVTNARSHVIALTEAGEWLAKILKERKETSMAGKELRQRMDQLIEVEKKCAELSIFDGKKEISSIDNPLMTGFTVIDLLPSMAKAVGATIQTIDLGENSEIFRYEHFFMYQGIKFRTYSENEVLKC